MQDWIRKLFRRDNFVALFLAVAAILTFFDIPQRFGLSEIKILIAMVGVLAVDSLIEKIGYLERIEQGIENLELVINPHPNTVLLQTRDSIPSFEECLQGVREVFVFAISANALVGQHYRLIQRALEEGTNFRFVLVSPDNPALRAAPASSPTTLAAEAQARWIEDTKNMLRTLARRKPKGSLELRFFDGLPTTSMVAYDLDRETGWIQVESHAHRQTPAYRPLFILRVKREVVWFQYFRGVCKELWNDSKPVPLIDVEG